MNGKLYVLSARQNLKEVVLLWILHMAVTLQPRSLCEIPNMHKHYTAL
jgi:hypothetical protein